jgi:hypothetical protein
MIKYFEIVAFDLWNLSPAWHTVRPVIHMYKKIASCSSIVTFFESWYPIINSSNISASKTCL